MCHGYVDAHSRGALGSECTHWFIHALEATQAYDIPASSSEATFAWVVMPPLGAIAATWTVYTDGSMLDGPSVLLRRCGWAFVALDPEGVVCASAHGVPPPWISTIFGAETWAALQAITHASGSVSLRIDCKAVVDLPFAGRDAAVSARRRAARAWSTIFDALVDAPIDSLSWIPAHTAAADVGVRRIGNGELLTARDRRGNDLADKLAKDAVGAHRVPERIRCAIAAQEEHVVDMAWWVAQVTVAANAWGPDKLRDSESKPLRRRQVGQPGSAARPRIPEEIPTALGGHDMVQSDAHISRSWQCRICLRTAARRSVLASSRCTGSAVRRWARQAAVVAGPDRGSGRGHTLLLTGSIVWCFRCGASVCERVRLLALPCRGRLEGLAQAHQRLLLGLHPTTRAPLGQATVPEPALPMPEGFASAVRRAESSATTATVPRVRRLPTVVQPREAPAWKTAMLARIAAWSAAADA